MKSGGDLTSALAYGAPPDLADPNHTWLRTYSLWHSYPEGGR